ncbi:MAG: SAM-dependent methyltransferase, partial [Actinomycetota bacterium]
FDGPELGSFEHKVITASYLPADWVAERLHRAGFDEVERRCRTNSTPNGPRDQGAIAAIAV